jgi:hypothetical protein
VPTICLQASSSGVDGAILLTLQPFTLAQAVRTGRRPAGLLARLSPVRRMFAFGDQRP